MMHPRCGLVLAGMAVCLVAGIGRAGGLNPTTAPGATMHTMEDVYRALAGTTAETKIGLNNTNAASPTMHTLEETYQLAVSVVNANSGTSCPVAILETGATTSWVTGDDGYYKRGAAWPNPIFTVGTAAASNCVTDNRTGLMWVRIPSTTLRDWPTALAYCEALDGSNGRGGYTDWRLPNVHELFSLADFGVVRTDYGQSTLPEGHPFEGPATYSTDPGVWTSTTLSWGTALAWRIRMDAGAKGLTDKTALHYVWAVRGGN